MAKKDKNYLLEFAIAGLTKNKKITGKMKGDPVLNGKESNECGGVCSCGRCQYFLPRKQK